MPWHSLNKFSICRVVFYDNPGARLWSTFPFGRFHDDHSPGRTSYWCFSIESAWREVLAHNPDADPTKFVVLQADLETKELLALTESDARMAFGVTREELVASRYQQTQELGAKIRARGIAALITYSYADQPDGRCLVVFEECLAKSKSKLAIRGTVPLLEALPELKE